MVVSSLVVVDGIVIGIYFLILIVISFVSTLRGKGTISGYFLASRGMHWVLVGASLFSSNIGSGHFIGLTGAAAASGIGVYLFEINAIFILLLLGWVFAPVYMAAGVFTMPHYIRKRFGGQRIRMLLAVISLLLSVFTKIAADLYAGALFTNELFPELNIYIAAILTLILAVISTAVGGLKAVMWTDTIQTVIMVVGTLILSSKAFQEMAKITGGGALDGYESTIIAFFNAMPKETRWLLEEGVEINSSIRCAKPSYDAMHLIRSYDDGNYPWPGMLIGLSISSLWYWCSDQVIVQRVLSAKSLSHAKGGTILAGYLKFLPLYLLVMPGMIARILYKDQLICISEESCKKLCDNASGCTNKAFLRLVIELMPDGLRGLMAACMMSALVSSLTSVFNSTSTIFTIDVYSYFRRNASQLELVIIGRIIVLVLAAISIGWIPVVKDLPQLFDYIQNVTSCLSPPICATFVLAVFWKRTTEKGVFFGLLLGGLIGMIRFILQFAYKSAPCGSLVPGYIPDIIGKVNFLHFGIILFGITAITIAVISLFTKPLEDKHLMRMTYWNRKEEGERADLSDDENNSARESSTTSVIRKLFINPDADDQNANALDEPEEEMSTFKKCCFKVCGIRTGPQPSTKEEMLQLNTCIEEEEDLVRILNVNAVLLLAMASALWGFYF